MTHNLFWVAISNVSAIPITAGALARGQTLLFDGGKAVCPLRATRPWALVG